MDEPLQSIEGMSDGRFLVRIQYNAFLTKEQLIAVILEMLDEDPLKPCDQWTIDEVTDGITWKVAQEGYQSIEASADHYESLKRMSLSIYEANLAIAESVLKRLFPD